MKVRNKMLDNGYKLGLVSVSFRKNDPREILEAMKKAGLSYIEWGSDIHAPCDDIQRLEEIAELQHEYAVECSSYGTYFRLGHTPIEELESYIQAAKHLGTDIIRLWCGVKSGKDMTDEEIGFLVDSCFDAVKIAEKHKAVLCMECHKKTFTQDVDDAVWLMNKVNSRSFKMYWQPFQWQSEAENIENAKKISPYAEHIHVFNWKDEEKLPLEDAVSEWQNYLSEFSVPRTLLLEFMPNGSIEELVKETNALRKIIGEK